MTASRTRRQLALALLATLMGVTAWVGAAGAAPVASTTLVINEIDYRQPGGDTAEFVELKNVGTADIDLQDYDLVGVNTNGTVYRRDAVATASYVLEPGGRYVVCGNAAHVPVCQRALMATDVWRGGDGGGDAPGYAIGLLKRVSGDALLDSVAYEGPVANGPNGEVWTEANPVTPGDNATDNYVGISRYPDGIDTDDNAQDVSRRCISPGGGNSFLLRPCSVPPTPTNTRAPTETPTTAPSPTTTPTMVITEVPPDVRSFTVNSEGDAGDDQPGDGTCGAGGACTLRAALQEVNASTHTGRFVIRFARVMTIDVPAPSPLPALTKSHVLITGVNPSERTLALAQVPAGLADETRVWLKGPGASEPVVGLELNGTSGSLVQGLKITDFRVGVLVHGGGSDNWVGTLPDGEQDVVEGNVLAFNGEAQVRLGVGSNNSVCGNQLGLALLGNPTGVFTEVGVDLVDGATGSLVGQHEDGGQVFGRANHIQWRHRYGVRLSGATTQGNRVAGNYIGATAAGDPVGMGNVVGVLLTNGATGNTVGGDGSTADVEANRIAFNTTDGVRVTDTAVGNTVAHNSIHHNRQHGLRLLRTAGGGTRLIANRITANGGAAIAYAGAGYAPAPPQIGGVSDVDGSKWRVSGWACAGCVVQVFADGADEAGDYLGEVTSDGTWALEIPAYSAVNVAASARGADGATSRLASLPVGLVEVWSLRSVPPAGPRAIGGQNLSRRFRLWNAARQPAAYTDVVFAPLDYRVTTDAQGYLDVAVPLATAVDFYSRGLSLSIEAVSSADGQSYPVTWYPALALAAEREPGGDDVVLDLGGLGVEGIGGVLRRAGSTVAWDGRWASPGLKAGAAASARRGLGGVCRWVADTGAGRWWNGPAQAGNAYGAAWTAAPEAALGEGQSAWQENMARGGGLYELKPGAATLAGQLEIVAPIAAWNISGPASGCNPPGAGAVMCGWDTAKGCWVPLAGSVAAAPAPGAETVTVRADVTVPPAGGAMTVYTVGFDLTPPVITPTITSGMVLAALPADVAAAVDAHAGVDRAGGVTVTVDGQAVPVTYDPARRMIVIAESARPLPPGTNKSADIVIEVTDGFCNRASRTVNVRLDASVPPTVTPTPTITPSPTVTPSASATVVATLTPTVSPGTPTVTPSAATATPTVTPRATASRTASPTPTIDRTATATPTAGTPGTERYTIYLPSCRKAR